MFTTFRDEKMGESLLLVRKIARTYIRLLRKE